MAAAGLAPLSSGDLGDLLLEQGSGDGAAGAAAAVQGAVIYEDGDHRGGGSSSAASSEVSSSSGEEDDSDASGSSGDSSSSDDDQPLASKANPALLAAAASSGRGTPSGGPASPGKRAGSGSRPSSSGGGNAASPAAEGRKRNNTFKRVRSTERCGKCRTCLNPHLKKACETIRAQQQQLKLSSKSKAAAAAAAAANGSASASGHRLSGSGGGGSGGLSKGPGALPPPRQPDAPTPPAVTAAAQRLQETLGRILSSHGKGGVTDPRHLPTLESLLEEHKELGPRQVRPACHTCHHTASMAMNDCGLWRSSSRRRPWHRRVVNTSRRELQDRRDRVCPAASTAAAQVLLLVLSVSSDEVRRGLVQGRGVKALEGWVVETSEGRGACRDPQARATLILDVVKCLSGEHRLRICREEVCRLGQAPLPLKLGNSRSSAASLASKRSTPSRT